MGREAPSHRGPWRNPLWGEQQLIGNLLDNLRSSLVLSSFFFETMSHYVALNALYWLCRPYWPKKPQQKDTPSSAIPVLGLMALPPL